jgi:hypothetical protein
VQGQLVQLNASTGAIQNVFDVVPSGCTGGSVWGPPTIDEAADRIYFATGNPGLCSSPYTEAVVELNASNLSLIGHYQVRGPDNVDLDFGSTPTLFQANINGILTNMVGVGNKDGTFYAFKRDALGSGPVWRATIGCCGSCPQCGGGTISPAAWDGQYLFVAGGNTTINGTSCKGSLSKLSPNTGTFVWRHCLKSGPVLGAVTVANGVAYLGQGSYFMAINNSSGATLFRYDTGSTIFWGRLFQTAWCTSAL